MSGQEFLLSSWVEQGADEHQFTCNSRLFVVELAEVQFVLV